MEGWGDGRLEGWGDGAVEGWKDGRMEEWKAGLSSNLIRSARSLISPLQDEHEHDDEDD
jgi:hypothetical protein